MVDARKRLVLVVEDEHARSRRRDSICSAAPGSTCVASGSQPMRSLSARPCGRDRRRFHRYLDGERHEGLELARTIQAKWPWIALVVTSGATARPPTGLPHKARYIVKAVAPRAAAAACAEERHPSKPTPQAA